MSHYENVPFEVPDSWEWCKVEDIALSILYGVSESAKPSGGYRLLRITDIQENKVEWSTVPYTDYDDIAAQKYILGPGVYSLFSYEISVYDNTLINKGFQFSREISRIVFDRRRAEMVVSVVGGSEAGTGTDAPSGAGPSAPQASASQEAEPLDFSFLCLRPSSFGCIDSGMESH